VEAHHIPPQRSGFYVRWVQEFVDFQPEIKLRDRSAADIERFLKFLGEPAGMADWQVKQAAYALRLLYEQFLPSYHPDEKGAATGTAGPLAQRFAACRRHSRAGSGARRRHHKERLADESRRDKLSAAETG
jgi:hypothetical protein